MNLCHHFFHILERFGPSLLLNGIGDALERRPVRRRHAMPGERQVTRRLGDIQGQAQIVLADQVVRHVAELLPGNHGQGQFVDAPFQRRHLGFEFRGVNGTKLGHRRAVLINGRNVPHFHQLMGHAAQGPNIIIRIIGVADGLLTRRRD